MKNKIALVTGGTSGIGFEIAKQLLSEGAKVVINFSSNQEQATSALEKLEKDFGTDNIMLLNADISNEDEVLDMFAQIGGDFGGLDFLINNAAINIDSLIENFNVEDFKKVIDVNLIGKFICTKHAIPLLKERKGAAIVNISSNLGVKTAPECGAYSAGAAGIINLTQTTALELAGTGIRANTVSPGFTPTPLSLASWSTEEIKEKERTNPMRRNATTTDIANTVLFLLSDKAAFINGQNISVNGGSLMK